MKYVIISIPIRVCGGHKIFFKRMYNNYSLGLFSSSYGQAKLAKVSFFVQYMCFPVSADAQNVPDDVHQVFGNEPMTGVRCDHCRKRPQRTSGDRKRTNDRRAL